MNIETFILELKKIGICITEEQIKKLDEFYKLLIEWNKKINLTRIIEKEEIYLKHFYDSLTLIKGIDLYKNYNICDVGSGAGFPGIVLKIIFPNLKITLVDSLNKRVIYLNSIIKELELKDIVAIHSRMEDFSRENEEVFDYITARAVADLNVLLEISVRALKKGGSMVFMKANCQSEIENSENALNKLSCKMKKIIEFELPIEKSNRTLLIIQKNNKTSSVFPRNIDKIRKKPL